MDLDAVANQVEFAGLVGVSQPAIAKHVQAGNLPAGGTFRQWLLVYSEKLRVEASGRHITSSRERLDLAKAVESETNAELKRRELYREDSLIVDTASVHRMMTDWVSLAKAELNAAVARVFAAIESDHGINLNREQLQLHIDAAQRSIGDYRFESGAAAEGSGPELDSDAEDTDD